MTRLDPGSVAALVDFAIRCVCLWCLYTLGYRMGRASRRDTV